MINNKANMFMGVMIAILIFASGVLFLPFLEEDSASARTTMDCTNMTITSGQKMTCLITDVGTPYFIWAFIAIAFGFVGGKLL